MLYHIPQTQMLSSAQKSLSPDAKQKSVFSELISFLIVAMIASFAISIIQSTVTTLLMMFDPGYHEIIESIVASESYDVQPLMDYMLEFLNSLPSEIHIVFLASSALYIVGAIIYCKRFEKRSLFSLGFNKRGILPEYVSGLILGAVMIALPSLICHLTGCIIFSFDRSASPLVIALFFVAFVLQGMGEEVLLRGYLMTSLTRRHSPWFAIIVSALTFSFFHIPNANFSIIAFINIVLFGIFAGVFMLKRGSIWAVCATHTAWNFLQGNIFGISVSGNPKFSSVLNATNADFGTILSGGEFGLEGGLGVTIVLLIALLLALMSPGKKSELDENSSEQCANEKG